MKIFLSFFIAFTFIACLAQAQPTNDLPVYQGKDLKIDVHRLRPHRAQLWARSPILDSVFNLAQVSYTLERSDYYLPDGSTRKGIRIRWSANTHSFEDETYVDAETFAIIKETGAIHFKSEKMSHAYYSKNGVVRTILYQDSLANSKKIKLKYQDYYNLIIMPYLFAASDLVAGTNFQLPYFSDRIDSETLIKVQIKGQVDYIDSYGLKRSAWRVDTDHGSAKLEWYLDKVNPPYLLGYRWVSYSDGKVIDDDRQSITKFIEYEGDNFEFVIRP